jgi:hypothetical protein
MRARIDHYAVSQRRRCHDSRHRGTWSRSSQSPRQCNSHIQDFSAANDPHGEHDLGAFDFDGTPVMFKIDYYDKDLAFSPDPADPSVTVRVITIMLANEY